MNLNFILPYAINQNRRSFGSGCGVPLIMLNDEKNGEGVTKRGFNLTVKDKREWLGERICNNLEDCYDVLESNTKKKYVLTKLNLGPFAVSNNKIKTLLEIDRPPNVMLCGSYQKIVDSNYFLGYLIDCRDNCTESIESRVCEKLQNLGNRYEKVTWFTNKERANFDIINKAFSSIESKVYQPYLDLALLHLSTAAVILCNSKTPLVKQRIFWCNLYNVPCRIIEINGCKKA